MVKNLPAMQETQVQSPGGEDPLEEGMATHSSILAWDISWTEEPGGPPPLPPPTTTSQENGSKKYFKSQAENWKMSCLSVWIKVYVSPAPEPSAKRPGS